MICYLNYLSRDAYLAKLSPTRQARIAHPISRNTRVDIVNVDLIWVNMLFFHMLKQMFKILFTYSGRIDRKTFIYGSIINVNTKRLHDLNHSGWWQLIIIIPGINILFWIFLASLAGNKENNIYGQQISKNRDLCQE